MPKWLWVRLHLGCSGRIVWRCFTWPRAAALVSADPAREWVLRFAAPGLPAG